jgi:putative transposase
MILFERYSHLRRNFRGHNYWARGYYVNTVGLDEQKVRNYIKNQQERDSIADKYDTDLVKDPFKGASSIIKDEKADN